MSVGTIVAKKKKPVPPSDRVDFVRVRVSGAYKDWLIRFAEVERSDMSDLIDDALAGHAKARGFELPPSMRTPPVNIDDHDDIEETDGSEDTDEADDGDDNEDGDDFGSAYERAVEEHDPTLEPYASMAREELQAALARAETAEEIAFLNEFLLDKATARELETIGRAHLLAMGLMRVYNAFGNAQCLFLGEVAATTAARIAAEMPARGRPEVCN